MRQIFLSTAPMLNSPKEYCYKNTELGITSLPTAFPISNLIAEYVKPEEENVVMTIVTKSEKTDTYAVENYNKFCQEVEDIAASKGAEVKMVEIEMSNIAKSDSHMDLFQKLIGSFNDDDIIYTDITYGFKSTPIVIFSVLNYLYKTKKNIDIKHIIYGHLYDGTQERNPEIFDITSLFYINSLSGTMANLGLTDKNDIISFLMND